MLTMDTVFQQLTGRCTVDALVEKMAAEDPQFAAQRQQYIRTMNALQKDLGSAVVEEMNAINRQCASDLLFAGMLGLKANWDHFLDPVAKNFLDVDFAVYLREETAHALPEYLLAQQARDRFYARLSPAQRELYEAVISYTSYLETTGPKLAHYYGYMLGNRLLPRIVPGYHPNTVQTIRYTDMLKTYFGDSLTGFGAHT